MASRGCVEAAPPPLLAAHQAAPDLALANALTPCATCCADVIPAIHYYAPARRYRSFDEMPGSVCLARRGLKSKLRRPPQPFHTTKNRFGH
jgi:hypothetical protein